MLNRVNRRVNAINLAALVSSDFAELCICSRLLESILVLLCSPATCNHAVVFGAIRSLLMTLMTTHVGLLYLSSKVETVNGILRVLMQNSVSVSIPCGLLYFIVFLLNYTVSQKTSTFLFFEITLSKIYRF